MHVLAIPGSLRTGSYNRALLEAAKTLAREPVVVEVYDDGQSIPLYNQDIDGDLSPQPVVDLRSRIRSADALLIATPEYNHGIPGVLKNLIDWASRPYGQSAFGGKPVSVVGASPSRFGAKWAQEAAITSLGSCGAKVVGGPHPVSDVTGKLDTDGRVNDSATLETLAGALTELAEAAAG